MKDKYYSIGRVSEICNIPIKTLRYYDKINVMVPNLRQENNNYRYYSHDQMVRLFIIKRLRYLGFSLEEVKNILKENDIKNIEVIVEEKSLVVNDPVTERFMLSPVDLPNTNIFADSFYSDSYNVYRFKDLRACRYMEHLPCNRDNLCFTKSDFT